MRADEPATPATLRVIDCTAQDTANSARASATLGQLDVKLFAALARATALRVSELNAQGFANTVWAFATAQHAAPQLAALQTIEMPLDGNNTKDS